MNDLNTLFWNPITLIAGLLAVFFTLMAYVRRRMSRRARAAKKAEADKVRWCCCRLRWSMVQLASTAAAPPRACAAGSTHPPPPPLAPISHPRLLLAGPV